MEHAADSDDLAELTEIHGLAQHAHILLAIGSIQSPHRFVPEQGFVADALTLPRVVSADFQNDGFADHNEPIHGELPICQEFRELQFFQPLGGAIPSKERLQRSMRDIRGAFGEAYGRKAIGEPGMVSSQSIVRKRSFIAGPRCSAPKLHDRRVPLLSIFHRA